MKHKKMALDVVMDCLRDQESGDARIFQQCYRDHFAFDRGTGCWHKWAGNFWVRQEHDEAIRHLDRVAEIYREAVGFLTPKVEEQQRNGDKDEVKAQRKIIEKLLERASDLGKFKRRDNVLKLARAGVDSLSISGNIWDAKPGLLALPNGVIELHQDHINFRPGKPKDYIRSVAATPWPHDKGAYDASNLDHFLEENPPQRWLQFMAEIFGKDQNQVAADNLIGFLQRLFGYSLSGDPVEHIFPIFYGPGRNGKSLLLEVLGGVMGCLAAPIQAEMLLAQGRSRSSAAPSPDILSLQGRLLLWGSEAEAGRQFDAARVKLLTGGDRLTGRALFSNNMVAFSPSHTLILISNNLPSVDSGDSAFWHRVRVIPFERVFVTDPQGADQHKADHELKRKLLAEAPGILAWLLRGWLSYQAQGLNTPHEVINATRAYRGEVDLVGRFIREACVLDPAAKIQASVLQKAFAEWCREEGISPLSTNRFSARMVRDFQKDTAGRHRYYLGLRLKSDAPERKLQAVHPSS